MGFMVVQQSIYGLPKPTLGTQTASCFWTNRSLPLASLAMPWSQSSSGSRKLKCAPRPWVNSCWGARSSHHPIPDRPWQPAHPRGGKKDAQQPPRPLGGSPTQGGRCGRGLVCVRGFKGRIFSHSDSTTSQNFSEVFFRGHGCSTFPPQSERDAHSPFWMIGWF